MTATITRRLPVETRLDVLTLAARNGLVVDVDGRVVVRTAEDRPDHDATDLVRANPGLLKRVEGDGCAWWEIDHDPLTLPTEDRPEVVAAAVRAGAVTIHGNGDTTRYVQHSPSGVPVADVTAVVRADQASDGRDGRTPLFAEVGYAGWRWLTTADQVVPA